MSLLCAFLLFVRLGAALPGAVQDRSAHTTVLLSADVRTGQPLRRPIAKDLVFVASPSRLANGELVGWELSVEHQRIKGRNFLLECLCGHGPVPSDIIAQQWLTEPVESLADRWLPVYGYPVNLRVECLKCDVDRKAQPARFRSGTLRVSVLRLNKPNPVQRVR